MKPSNKKAQLTLLYVALYTPGPAVPFTILPSDSCWRVAGRAKRDRYEALNMQLFYRAFRALRTVQQGTLKATI